MVVFNVEKGEGYFYIFTSFFFSYIQIPYFTEAHSCRVNNFQAERLSNLQIFSGFVSFVIGVRIYIFTLHYNYCGFVRGPLYIFDGQQGSYRNAVYSVEFSHIF